jgi:hypothetical protein
MPYLSLMADSRFLGTGLLLKKGELKFKDIYEEIPVTIIAKALDVGYNRVMKLREDPGAWTHAEIDSLAEAMDVEIEELYNWIRADVREK